MNNEIQFILYQLPDEEGKIQVVIKDETIWATQKAMAQLFDVGVPDISKHLKKKFETGELDKEVVVSFEPDDFDRTNIEELRYTKWLDYDKIDEVVVRTRKKGDFIVIDEDGSKKKLKKYFIDEKIPRRERDEVLLVADGSHVLWVVGYRISEDVKVTPKTKKVVRLDYKNE